MPSSKRNVKFDPSLGDEVEIDIFFVKGDMHPAVFCVDVQANVAVLA